MEEDWKSLIGKRILLRRKYLTSTRLVEAEVVEVSKSWKYVKFKWQSGSETWEVPGDEYSFNYDMIAEVLGLSGKKERNEEA